MQNLQTSKMILIHYINLRSWSINTWFKVLSEEKFFFLDVFGKIMGVRYTITKTQPQLSRVDSNRKPAAMESSLNYS